MEFTLKSPKDMLRSISVVISAAEVNQAFELVMQELPEDLSSGNDKSALAETSKTYSVKELQIKAQAVLADLAIKQATEAYHLQPIGRILFEGDFPSRDKDFSCCLHCEVLPKISLPEKLVALSVSVQEPSFETKDYHHFLQRLRRSKAQFQDVTEKRLPKNGDVVFLTINATYQGAAVLGMEHASIVIPLEAHYQESPELASAARLLHLGEQVTTHMLLPDGYPNKELCGKTIDIEVYLDDIKLEILPKVDDAFAISLGFKTMQEAQKFICHEILNKNITRFQRQAEDRLLNQLMYGLDFPLPASLLTVYKKEYLVQARNYYMQCGLDGEALQDKLQACQIESDQIAMKNAKRQAFLMAIGYREKIIISTTDIDQEIEKLAKQHGHDYTTLYENISASTAIYELQDRLLADKAMQLLYKQVQKLVVDKDGKPAKNAEISNPL